MWASLEQLTAGSDSNIGNDIANLTAANAVAATMTNKLNELSDSIKTLPKYEEDREQLKTDLSDPKKAGDGGFMGIMSNWSLVSNWFPAERKAVVEGLD